MKKYVFPLILAVLLCFVLCGCVISDSANVLWAENAVSTVPELENTTPQEFSNTPASSPNMASGVDSGLTRLANITNLAIFICFDDENVSAVQSSLEPNIINMFNAPENSLKDYYQKMSFGSLTINTLFARNPDNSYYVYKAPRARSYYASITSDSGSNRVSAEGTLLNDAVNAATNKFTYGSNVLDGNNDNYIDMVSFVISGRQANRVDAWGGLLWPHAWSLDYLSGGNKSSAKLNNICVNEFSFTFVDTYKVGYICHETGHVLGMPDLYHYDDKDHHPVGTWDLMHLNCTTPQFTTTYLRYKYLNFADESQIETLVKGGTYSLKPTSVATESETLAYKIEIDQYESIWIEYRNNNVSTYDSELPGSGLVVYRVNNKATGNEKAKYKNTAFPDELYVYRPEVIKNVEPGNLNYAYVSSFNEHFTKIGVDAAYKATYNQSAIYLTNGANTGIIITPTEQSDQSISFTVSLGEYDRSSITEITVLEQPYEMFFGETPMPSVKIKYQGSTSYVTPLPSRLSYTYNSDLIGTQTATVTYKDEQNELSTPFRLTIKDMVDINNVSVLCLPDILEYDINDTINLTGLIINITTLSGAEEQKVYSDINRDDWLIEGVDYTKSGDYIAEVTYLPLNVSVQIEIKILTTLVGIAILDKDTVTIIRTGGTPKLNVVGINADGSYRDMGEDEYRIEPYISDNYWTEQTLTVTYRAIPEYTSSTSLYVVEGVLSRINVTNPTITQYNYGSKLNLAGGKLRFEYSGGQSVSIAMDSYYSKFNDTFKSVTIGEQSLSAKIDGQTCTFTVKVLSQSSSFLSVTENEKANINIVGSVIYLKKEYTLIDFETVFMSYLDITFIYNDSLYVNSNTFPSLKMGNKVKMLLSNGEKTIATYSIVLMGDTNADGQLNQADVAGMILAIMQERTNLIYLDINNDGLYTLTDFVLWIALLEER